MADWTQHLARILKPLIEKAKQDPDSDAALETATALFGHLCHVAELQGQFETLNWLRTQPGTAHLQILMAKEVVRITKEMEVVGAQVEALGQKFIM